MPMHEWSMQTEIEGYIETNPEYAKFCDPGKRVKMYFVAKLSKKPLQTGSFVDSIQKKDAIEPKALTTVCT